jgi:hypothetical protein
MPHRIAVAVEGPSDAVVVETICRKKGHFAKAAYAQGKPDLFLKFDKILRALEATIRPTPTHFLVVADLHPAMDCPTEAERWREAIRDRFSKAKLCLCIWELEAWLLADASAVGTVMRRRDFHHSNPEKIGDPKPSEILEDLFRKELRYVRGVAYDKQTDGERIALEMDLDAASKNSPSLAHFLRLLEARQARLV